MDNLNNQVENLIKLGDKTQLKLIKYNIVSSNGQNRPIPKALLPECEYFLVSKIEDYLKN